MGGSLAHPQAILDPSVVACDLGAAAGGVQVLAGGVDGGSSICWGEAKQEERVSQPDGLGGAKSTGKGSSQEKRAVVCPSPSHFQPQASRLTSARRGGGEGWVQCDPREAVGIASEV